MSTVTRAPKIGTLLTAMLTPFDERGAIDFDEAARLAHALVDQGNDGLVISGTTGESPALEDDETVALVRAVKASLGDKGSVVAGAGSYNTHHAVEMTKRVIDAGADGVLSVVPYYSKPTQDGMLRHFGAIAEAATKPVIIYNIPHRTGINMLPATLVELAKRYETIAGVKESTGDSSQFSAILRDRPAGFGFWSGDDHQFLPSLAVGGDGLIGVASHLCAREFKEIFTAYRGGDVARAAQIHLSLGPLFGALFATSSPIPVKWAMQQLGFKVGACRSPLGVMPEDLKARLGPLIEPYRVRFS
jgi:4-hydroxy-tetrahydrodipicolinate synthase